MPAAEAAPGVPAPTVTIATTVSGQVLPVSTMTGNWTVKQPGRAASLKVSGAAATGTITTIRSTWVSSMRRSIGVQFLSETDYTTAAPGTQNNSVAIHVQFRSPHGAWQEMGRGQFSHTSQPLDVGGEGVGAAVEFLRPTVLQFRVQMTVTYDDTSQQTFRESVKTF
jgi:hypothetical protein